MDSVIQKIRASISLFEAWRILDLPGTPRKGDLRSPFREDKRASFTIYSAKDHLRFHDHASGEGGDVVDLWARAKGISVKDAIAEITGSTHTPARAPDRPPEAVFPPQGIRWPPDLRAPSEAEYRALAALRGLSPGAFAIAGNLGTLKVATVYGAPAWIITDSSGRCAEARRFDGLPFTVSGKERKGFCLPGSKKDWPLGLKTKNPAFDHLDNLLLVEGMPDYYAALHLAIESEINFRPIAILGAGLSSFADATQQYLTQKKILIICHNDPPGQAALPKWVKELYRLGAAKVLSQALPLLHDDLNDFLQNPGPDQPLDLLKGFLSNATGGRSIP
jgi:hypothetical protein